MRSTVTSERARGPDELKALLRTAGLRSTAPRMAVLRQLLAARAPVSHAELIDALAAAGIDPTTIYRNLKDLVEADLVSRRDLGDHVWRFEWKRDGDNHARTHPHFMCDKCGSVACLSGTSVDVSPGPRAPRALAKGAVEIQLKGRCDRCR